MAKYNYSKEPLKGLGIGNFMNQVKTRDAMIEKAPDTLPISVFNANRLAAALHPAVQHTKVGTVIEHEGAKSFVLVPDSTKGTTSLAYHRAGQYLSVSLKIGDSVLTRPYSIRSGPGSALGTENTSYTLTIRGVKDGFASNYILENWTVGTEVEISAPLGEFYYERLRDAKQVIALAGGSGITPFYSMASAIADGIEDFHLTILYGSRTVEAMLLYDELKQFEEKSNGKVQVVPVLSDEEKEGFEHGFLTAELIQKYAENSDYSLFMCGPRPMYAFEDGEVIKLGLLRRRVRRELFGEYKQPEKDAAYPQEATGKTFTLTVLIHGEKTEVSCKSSETLLCAMERAGIHAPSHCRSGECGWCHSHLLAGTVYVPEVVDGRRAADIKFGWIHPCCSFPTSDITLDVPVV